MKLLDGKLVSEEIKKNIKITSPLKLVVIQIGDDEASNVYIRSKEKLMHEYKVQFELIKFPADVEEYEVINEIKELNVDEEVTGMILQLPIPERFNKWRIINTIDPKKDIDGLTNFNIGKTTSNNMGLMPCTPLGIIKILEYYDINVASKNIVVVGRSTLVGKPIANMLVNLDATVTICHSKTNNLKEFTKNADILIVAVGKKGYITGDMIKEDAIIIDVGINRFDGKLYGDVDFESVKDKVSYITPVPGGVGPMTVTMILNNLLLAKEIQDKVRN